MAWRARIAVLSALLVMALLPGPERVGAAYIADKPMRVVCTSPYWPLARCMLGDPNPTGYEVELFKSAVQRVADAGHPEWNPGNWTWMCWDQWDAALQDMLKPPAERTCDVLVEGVSATDTRKADGLQFSYPTLLSGRRIMIHFNPERSMWSFLDPFEPSLWLACLATSVVVGLLLLLSESAPRTLWAAPGPAMSRMAGLQWAALGVLLRTAGQLSPRSAPGRMMLLSYACLALVLTNLYISSMAALLSRTQPTRHVSSMEDLAALPVGLFVDDKHDFQRFALGDVRYYAWSDQADEDAMLTDLRRGVVAALVLDAPWVKYVSAASCDLFAVGDIVLPVHLGFVFSSDVPAEYVSLFDSSLSYLDDSGDMVSLARKFLLPPNPCYQGTVTPQDIVTPQLRLGDVAGLWVILAAAVGLAAVWAGAQWLAPRMAASNRKVEHAGPGFMPGKGSGGSMHLSDAPDGDLAQGVVGTAATQDEALQALESRMREMDVLIRHMPFVMTATMDSRLIELRGTLLAAIAAAADGGGHELGSGLPLQGSSLVSRDDAGTECKQTVPGDESGIMSAVQGGLEHAGKGKGGQQGELAVKQQADELAPAAMGLPHVHVQLYPDEGGTSHGGGAESSRVGTVLMPSSSMGQTTGEGVRHASGCQVHSESLAGWLPAPRLEMEASEATAAQQPPSQHEARAVSWPGGPVGGLWVVSPARTTDKARSNVRPRPQADK